jgi:hypothetical protein
LIHHSSSNITMEIDIVLTCIVNDPSSHHILNMCWCELNSSNIFYFEKFQWESSFKCCKWLNVFLTLTIYCGFFKLLFPWLVFKYYTTKLLKFHNKILVMMIFKIGLGETSIGSNNIVIIWNSKLNYIIPFTNSSTWIWK